MANQLEGTAEQIDSFAFEQPLDTTSRIDSDNVFNIFHCRCNSSKPLNRQIRVDSIATPVRISDALFSISRLPQASHRLRQLSPIVPAGLVTLH
jgi:hypothetical protein